MKWYTREIRDALYTRPFETTLTYMLGLAWRPKSVYSVVRQLLHRSPKAVTLELYLPLGHFFVPIISAASLFLKLCASEFNWAIAASIKYSWLSVHVTLWEIPALYLYYPSGWCCPETFLQTRSCQLTSSRVSSPAFSWSKCSTLIDFIPWNFLFNNSNSSRMPNESCFFGENNTHE